MDFLNFVSDCILKEGSHVEGGIFGIKFVEYR